MATCALCRVLLRRLAPCQTQQGRCSHENIVRHIVRLNCLAGSRRCHPYLANWSWFRSRAHIRYVSYSIGLCFLFAWRAARDGGLNLLCVLVVAHSRRQQEGEQIVTEMIAGTAF